MRSHWAIENNLHWILDVTFNEDLSRLRTGHGAKNMAVVRHFALNLVRQVADKRSIKRRRKRAAWDPQYLLDILGPLPMLTSTLSTPGYATALSRANGGFPARSVGSNRDATTRGASAGLRRAIKRWEICAEPSSDIR